MMKIHGSILKFGNILSNPLLKNLAILLVLSPLIIQGQTLPNPAKTDITLIHYYIDIEKNIDNIKTVKMSDFGSDLEYIPLETRTDLILGSLVKAVLYDDKIFVSDQNQIYMFTRGGEFIRKIGKKGNGPGEYSSPNFFVDKQNQLVYVATPRKVTYFDFEGNFIKSFPTEFVSNQLIFPDKNTLLFYNMNLMMPLQTESSHFSWYLSNKNGEILSKIEIPVKGLKSPFVVPPAAPLYMYNNLAHFAELWVDSLYRLINGKPLLYATFNRGKLAMAPSEMSSKNGQQNGKPKILIQNIYEDDSYIYIEMMKNQNSGDVCLYDKNNGTIFIAKNHLMLNDLDGGMDFWPKSIDENNTMVGYEDAFTILSRLNSNDQLENKGSNSPSADLLQLKNRLTENSNPVVILLKR